MRSVAVLGATGALGKATVDELIKQKISVKILVRDIEKYKALYPKQKVPGRVNAVQGDLDTNQSIATVMENIDTVFLCYNTNLQYWERDMINWTDKIAKVAAALEARIIYPGCKLNYGIKDAPISEEDTQNANSEIGQLKIALEKRLYRAAQEGAKLTIIRFSPIYGPADFNSQFSKVFEAAIKNRASTWIGNVDINHDFLYSKDAANVFVKAALSENAVNKVFHFEGKKILVKEWISKIYKFVGSEIPYKYNIQSELEDKIKGLFSKEKKLKNQLRYFTENEIYFDGSLFKKEIGSVQITPFDTSLPETLDWYKYWFQNQS
ncbi:MAG: GDP-L-fucose synthase [Candidatus Heimdallarchaeota archaeon LC_2]|nr:MAG: GDP-L-fucose synthase [Candidatus Heimdallarchaeota archaeon LC_2]